MQLAKPKMNFFILGHVSKFNTFRVVTPQNPNPFPLVDFGGFLLDGEKEAEARLFATSVFFLCVEYLGLASIPVLCQ